MLRRRRTRRRRDERRPRPGAASSPSDRPLAMTARAQRRSRRERRKPSPVSRGVAAQQVVREDARCVARRVAQLRESTAQRSQPARAERPAPGTGVRARVAIVRARRADRRPEWATSARVRRASRAVDRSERVRSNPSCASDASVDLRRAAGAGDARREPTSRRRPRAASYTRPATNERASALRKRGGGRRRTGRRVRRRRIPAHCEPLRGTLAPPRQCRRSAGRPRRAEDCGATQRA